MFDAETFGLFGDPFAYGYVLFDETGLVFEQALCACGITTTKEDYFLNFPNEISDDKLKTLKADCDWLINNIPDFSKDPLLEIAENPQDLRSQFLKAVERIKKQYPETQLVTDCMFPVESNFLTLALKQQGKDSIEFSPMVYDIGLIQLLGGKEFPFLPEELPKHNPLNDAKQSARILLNYINGQEDMLLSYS